MSKAISLKINDDIFKETEDLVTKMHVPRNSYINHAINYYNRMVKRNLLKKQYLKESTMVRHSSLAVNAEFAQLDDEIAGG